jgi:hypothetical protein
MPSEAYCKAAVKNVELKLCKDRKRLPSKCDTPMKLAYRPELDDTAELKAEGVQFLSGACWRFTLGS